jgi:mRNA-degrading endonuclease RelE of RelBE toxin-antitoxin system
LRTKKQVFAAHLHVAVAQQPNCTRSRAVQLLESGLCAGLFSFARDCDVKFNFFVPSPSNALPNSIPSFGIAQVRALPRDARRLIGEKLDRAQKDLACDIKKLKGFKTKYRVRAGNYRVLFELERGCLVVYGVGDRKDIYV